MFPGQKHGGEAANFRRAILDVRDHGYSSEAALYKWDILSTSDMSDTGLQVAADKLTEEAMDELGEISRVKEPNQGTSMWAAFARWFRSALNTFYISVIVSNGGRANQHGAKVAAAVFELESRGRFKFPPDPGQDGETDEHAQSHGLGPQSMTQADVEAVMQRRLDMKPGPERDALFDVEQAFFKQQYPGRA